MPFEQELAAARALGGRTAELTRLKDDAKPRADEAVRQKGLAEAAKNGMQDPSYAKAYMSNSLAATQAKMAMDVIDSGEGPAKQVEASREAHAARLKSNAVNSAVDDADTEYTGVTVRYGGLDPNTNVLTGGDRGRAELFREKVKETAEAAAEAITPAKESVPLAEASLARVGEANGRVTQVVSSATKAAKGGLVLSDAPPPGIGEPAASEYGAKVRAAKAAAQTLDPMASNAKAAAKLSADAQKDAEVAVAAAKQEIATKSTIIEQVNNRPKLNNPMPDPASDNRVKDDVEAFNTAADRAYQNAVILKDQADEVASKAENASTEADNALQLQGAALRAELKKVHDAAKDAASKIPYDSADNAAKAKDALDAAKKAAEESSAAEALCKAADDEIKKAQEIVDKAKEALNYFKNRRDGAVRRSLEDAKRDIKRKLSDVRLEEGFAKSDAEKASQKIAAAKRAVDSALKAYNKAQESSSAAPVGVAKCPDQRVRSLEGTRKKIVKDAEQASDKARALTKQADELEDQLGDLEKKLRDRNWEDLDPDTPAFREAAKNLNDAAEAAKAGEEALAELKDEAAKVKEECARAKKALDEAVAAKKAAVDNRIEQLMQEGHGPQRHEGQVDPEVLAERAYYKIDPESRTQADAETGELHGADEIASKFNDKDAYVKAEAIARADLVAENPPGLGKEYLKPLALVGPEAEVASGKRSTGDPGMIETSLGKAKKIPTTPAYVPGPDKPPPSRLEMDGVKMADEARDNTEDVNFAGGDLHAIYRQDVNGKWFLRTMWSEPR